MCLFLFSLFPPSFSVYLFLATLFIARVFPFIWSLYSIFLFFPILTFISPLQASHTSTLTQKGILSNPRDHHLQTLVPTKATSLSSGVPGSFYHSQGIFLDSFPRSSTLTSPRPTPAPLFLQSISDSLQPRVTAGKTSLFLKVAEARGEGKGGGKGSLVWKQDVE